MHYDITTKAGVGLRNIVSKIGNIVKKYAKHSFKPKDFVRIIHITDMDGAFIEDSNVIFDSTRKKTFYSVTEIRTCNRDGITDRNRRKRENLTRLINTSKVWGIPYQLYYMSCNLEYAVYGKLNCSDEEKEKYAYCFAERFKEDIPGFLKFISN